MATEMTYGASSSSHPWKYDVFLSFRGQDTRKNFTDYLFNELVRDGIHTFRDDEELNRGEDIPLELKEAIESSRIAIIVFSKNYASSTWCLNELAKIVECKKDGQPEKVLPVFYKVDPSDVRHQRNTYAKAFKRHEKDFKKEKEKLKRWRSALTEVANLSGWDQANIANGHEAELTKKIVEEVCNIVNKTRLDVAEHPIGLDSHIKHIACLLNNGRSDVVRIIGIYGPGGIGKTTIAKAVFNVMFRNFEGSSFLANVREVSRKEGLTFIQKQLLCHVLKRKERDIYYEDQGITNIKDRLCCKRVFIVLDDMDEKEQFNKLVGGHDSLAPGSRIILTTRDEHLLKKLKVDEKYMVGTMNRYESLQLFSLHAFQKKHPDKDYEQLSTEVVDYAGGLPLALVVLGSLLYKRNQVEWERELKKLRKIPHGRIFEKLEISYNALDESDQTIFLDISCFFIGKDINVVISILDACGLGGEAGIKILTERSLVTIDDKNMLCMHDLIRDMGREIVRKLSPSELGVRSRLWDNEDSIYVLKNLTGTSAVEGFQLKLFRYNVKKLSCFIIEGFSKMPNLRLLEVDSNINYDNFDEAQSLQEGVCCFRNLVWVNWEGFPFDYIPNSFHLGNIVIIDMQFSKLKEVWKQTKLTKLKELNLSFSPHLTCLDFSRFPNLEKLILKGCRSLVEVHENIDHLKKLVILNLRNCSNLKNLPSSISELASLETLDISLCSELEALSMLSSERLESLPMLPSSLRSLKAHGCRKLTRLPNLSNLKHLTMLHLSECEELTEIEGLEGLKSAATIHLLGCIRLKSSFKERIFQDLSNDLGSCSVCDIILDENEVPEWFGFQTEPYRLENQDSLTRQVITLGTEGLIICVCLDITLGEEGYLSAMPERAVVVLKTKDFTWRHEIIFQSFGTITWVITIPQCVWKSAAKDNGNTINVSFQRTSGKFVLKKIGVHSSYANGHEAKLIKKIGEEELEHPIGLKSHIEHICCLLNDGEFDVRIIGIYGPSGIGKTTIVKAVFNEMSTKFEGSNFIANASDFSSQLECRRHHKRVLIVLDDVEEYEQFARLLGNDDWFFSRRHQNYWFCPGSRIIFTTRDEYLLDRLVDEIYIYRVETMNQNESLQLFSRYAFRQNHPLKDYVQLSNDVISHAMGLPLALVILGSLLYKRSKVEWESELKILRKIPNGQILEKLEISYNALDEFKQTTFLDISCFFIGEDKNCVITFLDACGMGGEDGLKLLMERSLITIDEDNRLRMHDLIRDMGRKIIRKQSPWEPGRRSRLWDNDDTFDVLRRLTGTDAVEGLQLDLSRYDTSLLTTEGFYRMCNLRFLKVHDLSDDIRDREYSLQEKVRCFRNLVWISWDRFPFEYIPNDFNLGSLVMLDLQRNKLREVWKGAKYLIKLKYLNLSHSRHLTHTPEFSGVPNLEKLILTGCESLVEVDESIDLLKKLVNLDLGHCCNLKNLPSGIRELISLETLNISGCSELNNFPEGFGNLKRLTRLEAENTAIRELPSSFGPLPSLTTFLYSSKDGIDRLSVSLYGFCSLKELTLENCNLRDDDIPDDFWMLYSLKSLDLSGNYFESLPSSIDQLSELQSLNVFNCKRLNSLPMLPSSLHSLDASSCGELKRLPNLSNLKHMWMLHLSNCKELIEIEGLEGLKSVETIKLNKCPNLKRFVKKRIFQDISTNNVCDIILDGNVVPGWFSFQSDDLGFFLELRQITQLINKLIICLYFPPSNGGISGIERQFELYNISKHFEWWHRSVIEIDRKEGTTWMINIPNFVWESIAGYEDTIHVSSFVRFFDDMKTGAHFFYASDTQHENLSAENSEAASPTSHCFGFLRHFGTHLQDCLAAQVFRCKKDGSKPVEAEAKVMKKV